MLIYFFSKEDRGYLEPENGPIEALNDPVEGKPMIPNNALTVEPPVAGENECARVLGDLSGWEIVPDFRGRDFWDVNTKEIKRFKLGESPGELFVDVEPADFEETWTGSEWVLLFSVKQARKYNEIKICFEDFLALGCEVQNLGFRVDSRIIGGSYIDASNLSLVHQNAVLFGQTEVSITDFDDVDHTLTIPELEGLLGELAVHTQAARVKKNSIRLQIYDADLTESEDETALNLIKWEL